MFVDNKVVIVTGGIKGIGFVSVQHLLRNGARYVAVFDLAKFNSKDVIDAMTKLEDEFNPERFGYFTCDVTKDKEFNGRYQEILKLKKYVDILINNAGVCNENNPDLTIDVNFKAIVKCTMTAIEHMGKHKGYNGGVVINIGSIYGLLNNAPLIPIYNATKHAVVSFVRSMKEHNEKFGMRIMCICPGMTKTDMTTSGDVKILLRDFVSNEMIVDHGKLFLQDPNNVASAIIEILEKGKAGNVWLVQNDEPPFNVGEETDIEKLRIPFE